MTVMKADYRPYSRTKLKKEIYSSSREFAARTDCLTKSDTWAGWYGSNKWAMRASSSWKETWEMACTSSTMVTSRAGSSIEDLATGLWRRNSRKVMCSVRFHSFLTPRGLPHSRARQTLDSSSSRVDTRRPYRQIAPCYSSVFASRSTRTKRMMSTFSSRYNSCGRASGTSRKQRVKQW